MHTLDQESFGEIYETYFSRVYNYISYRISDHADVEDLVSQVFLRVIEKYADYNPGRAPLEAWIIGIAKNAVTDSFRARSRHPEGQLEQVENTLSGGDQPERIYVQNEDNRQLVIALGRLKDRERQIVALKYGAELGNKQIADIMGLSESNVGVILFRSLAAMRKIMEALDQDTYKKEELEWDKTPMNRRTGCRG